MAKIRYSKVAMASMSVGVVLTGIEVYGAVAYLLEQGLSLYLVLAGAVLTGGAAALIPLSERCFRDGRYFLSVLLLVALIPALSIVTTAAIDRTGGARDKIGGDHQAKSAAIQLKKDAVDDAKADLDRLQVAEDRECNTAKPGADPRGSRCKSAEKRTEEGRTRLSAARGELASAGVAPKDPMVTRLAAVLPVSEEAIATYHPLILPCTVSLLGLLFIAAGARPARPKPVVRKGKRKKRRKAVKASDKAPNVVPMIRKRA